MPTRAKRQAMIGRGEILLYLAPDPFVSEQDVRAMIGVDRRRLGRHRLFGIGDGGERLVIDLDQLGRVLGQGAAFGHDGCDPLAGIARQAMRQRIAAHFRDIEAAHHGIGRGNEIGAGDHCACSRQSERLARVDATDTCEGIRAGHKRDMQHARQRDIGDEARRSGQETAIFLGAAFLRNVAKLGLSHVALPEGCGRSTARPRA